MPFWGWIILLVVVFGGWGGGYWAGPAPVRGNNLLHIVLVVVLAIVLISWLTGTPYVPRHHYFFGR